MKVFVSQKRKREKRVESSARHILGKQKSSSLGKDSQGGVCYFKNSETTVKVTGNLRRAEWTQGQGKLHRKAEIERNQRTEGQIDVEVLLHEQDREARKVCRRQNKENFKRQG